MKICIYHGFVDIHYEMFGYLLEYFKFTKLKVNIYAVDYNDIGAEWKAYYENKFNIKLEWINPFVFKPDDYELIILITDDDRNFKQEWMIKDNKLRVITIDHHARERRKDALFRIATRFYVARPSCQWALPCYYGLSMSEKERYLYQNNLMTKIKVSCIGVQNIPTIDFLKKLFINYDDIEFHIIAREIKNEIKGDNIMTYPQCPTAKMFEILNNTQYILLIDREDNQNPILNSISGAIPMGLSYGCQLIIPKKWQTYYNLKSVIQYEDKPIKLNKKLPLKLIYQELYNMISHRNKVLDTAIECIYPLFRVIKPYNCWYSELVNCFKIKRPNIFVSFDNPEDIDIIKKDFREIHLINQKIEERYIYNNTLEEIIDIVEEPCIFKMTINSSIKDNLEIIGKRKYRDIIIIINYENYIKDNPDYNTENLLKAFNKMSIFYNVFEHLILLPQK